MNDHSTLRPDGGETFADAVTAEFSFLVDRGFDVSVEGDDVVTYEAASGAFIKVFRDPRDRHAGFRVGITSRPRDAITTAEFARLTGASSGGEYPAASSDYSAAAARLAQLLRDHGSRVLVGDGTILDEAMELRREYTKRFTGDNSRVGTSREQHSKRAAVLARHRCADRWPGLPGGLRWASRVR